MRDGKDVRPGFALRYESENLPIRGLIKHQLRRFAVYTTARLMTSKALDKNHLPLFQYNFASLSSKLSSCQFPKGYAKFLMTNV